MRLFPRPNGESAEANVVAAIVFLSLVITMIPAGFMLKDAVTQELKAHTQAAERAAEVARIESEAARQNALAAENDAKAAKDWYLAGQKAFFCAQNPDHPECALPDNEWIDGFTCARVDEDTVVCTD